MSAENLLESTLEGERLRASRADWAVPSLTILYHPDPARVGETVRLLDLLSGRSCLLSRLSPGFRQPAGKGPARPLRDPYVSRMPVSLSPESGGLRIAPGRVVLAVGGETLSGPRHVSRAELESGLVLELSGRVVLLLHALGPPAPRRPALGFVGESEAMEKLRAEILRVGDLSVPLLLSGESGTGKELAARAAAGLGPRAAGPFVPVNMGALPLSLAMTELFGHEAGAFTGAIRARPGWFALAQGGTLFLDEIGTAPMELQGGLLRTLQSNEIQPVGSGRTQKVDVRVISATDVDLEEAIAKGIFREALYHRLASYRIRVPPLRERRDDIGRLLFHFLRDALSDAGAGGRLAELSEGEPWLPARVVARLAALEWPGNVRQLANAARSIAVRGRSGEPVRFEDLPLGKTSPAEVPAVSMAREGVSARPAEIGEETLLAALRENRWRVGATARKLGISRNSLYALMQSSTRVRKAKDVARDEIERAYEDCQGDLDAMAEQLQVSARGIRLRLTELGRRT